MQIKGLSSNLVDFRSIEEAQIAEMHPRQNGDLGYELAYMLDFEFPWAPRSLAQIRAKVEEIQKQERTVLFAIFSKSNEFVGLAQYSAVWDAWEPYVGVIVWPEHRRKGYGSETARLLLEVAFMHDIAHVTTSWIADWDETAIAFAESLGFKRAGVQRRTGVREGKFFNVVAFDMLRDEYLARRKWGGGK